MINAVALCQDAADKALSSANNGGSSASSADAFITPIKEMQRDRLKEVRRKMMETAEAGSAKKKRRVSLEGSPDTHQDGSSVLQSELFGEARDDE